MKKREIIFVFGILIILLLLTQISAFGVSTPYWDDNQLKLAPGESKTVSLMLQNMIGNEEVILSAELTSGNEVATLIDDNLNYLVPFGRDDIPVNVKIEVPKNTEIGKIYEITLSFKQVSSGEGGMLHVVGAFTSKFPVQIVGEQESALYGTKSQIPTKDILIIGGLIILVILIPIIYRILKKRKKFKKRKK